MISAWFGRPCASRWDLKGLRPKGSEEKIEHGELLHFGWSLPWHSLLTFYLANTCWLSFDFLSDILSRILFDTILAFFPTSYLAFYLTLFDKYLGFLFDTWLEFYLASCLTYVGFPSGILSDIDYDIPLDILPIQLSSAILFCPSFWHSVGHTFWHSFPDVLTFYLASTLTFSLVLTGILLLIRLAYTLAWARVRRVKLHPEMEGEMKTTNR